MIFLDWDFLVLIGDCLIYPGKSVAWVVQEEEMKIVVKFATGGVRVFSFDDVEEFGRYKELKYGAS
jgi:hypothetical protein